MSMRFTNVDHYTAPSDAVWAMLADRAYWDAKYAALEAREVEWRAFEVGDETLSVSTVRHVAAHLPGFVAMVIGDSAVVTQTETWQRDGATLHCQIEIETRGVPGGIHGSMIVQPTDAGADWSADLDVKVYLPWLGHRFEGFLTDETRTNFGKEKTFNDGWLAERA